MAGNTPLAVTERIDWEQLQQRQLPSGETVISSYTFRELLDKLDQLASA